MSSKAARVVIQNVEALSLRGKLDDALRAAACHIVKSGAQNLNFIKVSGREMPRGGTARCSSRTGRWINGTGPHHTRYNSQKPGSRLESDVYGGWDKF